MEKRVSQDLNDPIRTLYESPGYLIRVARQKAVACFEPVAARHRITAQQYAIMRVVSAYPDIDQNDLGERVSLDGSTLSEIVVRMERRGLLGRRADGRYRRLTLTAEAGALLGQIHPEVTQSLERLLEPLTARESERFLQLLSKLTGVENRFNTPRRRRPRVPRTPG